MDAGKIIKDIFSDSIGIKTDFFSSAENIDRIRDASGLLISSLRSGGKILVFGNGGSAADSQHMAAELVVRFEKEREALPCIALSANTSNLTASANDYDFDRIFSRQIEALAAPGDVAVAISTSGNSRNVLEGALRAKDRGMKVIAITGRDGGKLAPLADTALIVGHDNTARVQEVHVMIIHILCRIIEDSLF